MRGLPGACMRGRSRFEHAPMPLQAELVVYAHLQVAHCVLQGHLLPQ